jgi:ParB/RepB/Spo0J family partition protein
MAVQFQATHSRTSEYRMLPEAIVIKPSLNGRHVLPDIEPLIQDILLNGQHTPVVIRNDGGQAVLCAGFSRWRAISEINKRKLAPVPLQVRCTYTQSNEQQGFLLAISENRSRNATTELDDAYNITRLMKQFGMTEEQIAEQYFPGGDQREAMRFVKQRMALVNLSPEAEKMMIAGRLKGSAAVKIAKMSQAQQKEYIENAPTAKIKAPANGHVPLKKVLTQALKAEKITIKGKAFVLPDEVVEWLQGLLK